MSSNSNQANRDPRGVVESHLNSLSKKELVELLLNYAPEGLITEIKNSYSSSSEVEKIFRQTEKEIRRLFADPENLYSPYEFESALVANLGYLAGLEKQIKNELGNLIIYIISQVEKAFDQGYLYDNYGDDPFYSPLEFDALVKNYLLSLPFTDKLEYIERLDAQLAKTAYSTFEHLPDLVTGIFNEEELPALKILFLSHLTNYSKSILEKYYVVLRVHLSFIEREEVLMLLLEESNWLVELLALLREQNKSSAALKQLEMWLKKQPAKKADQKVYEVYLELLNELDLEIEPACVDAISNCANALMLEKIAALKISGIVKCEEILERLNPGGLLDYLEKAGRLDAAISLIKRGRVWDHRVFSFFTIYKAKFIPEAEKFFHKRIVANLEVASDSHYRIIADTLAQLDQINPLLADKLLREIRLNFARRRNLMALLPKV